LFKGRLRLLLWGLFCERTLSIFSSSRIRKTPASSLSIYAAIAASFGEKTTPCAKITPGIKTSTGIIIAHLTQHLLLSTLYLSTFL
jgi:hypothetical protein